MTEQHCKIVVSILLLTVLAGCSVLKARPAEHAGFLPEPELVAENRDRAPFNWYWVFDPEGYHKLRQNYGKVYVAPVDTAVVEEIFNASKGSEKVKNNRIEEAEEIARFFEASLKLILEEEGQGRIEVVDEPGPGTLELQLALIQVIPTNPGVNFVGTAAGFFVPGAGLISILAEGSVAMEGYVIDGGQVERLYEQYKDREGEKTAPFDFKDYQRYAHIREAIVDWAFQITHLLTTPPDHTVEDSAVISINPV